MIALRRIAIQSVSKQAVHAAVVAGGVAAEA
jgi:hypothetical protein